MPSSVKVAILEDHQSIVDGYMMRLQGVSGIEVVGIAANSEDLDFLLRSGVQIDVLLMDVQVPASSTNRALIPFLTYVPEILKKNPNMRILVISVISQGRFVKAAIESGASGYVFKSDSESIYRLPAIIKTIASGGRFISEDEQLGSGVSMDGYGLTNRQMEVLLFSASHPDMSNEQMALQMGIAHSTFRNLLSEAYQKLDVHSKAAAIERVRSMGMFG